MQISGIVYLIHLDRKYRHAQHYLGFAYNPIARLHFHRTGRGSKLLAAANLLGITYRIVRQWAGDRTLERKLKNYKKSRQLCPVCRQNHLNGKMYAYDPYAY